jgi:hypothetical protein
MIDSLSEVTEMMTLPQMTQMTQNRKNDDDNVLSLTCPFFLGGSSFILHP